MKNAVNWFEIPTTDLDRAARFYEATLGIKLRREIFGGVPHAIFTAPDPAVGGALIFDEKRRPGAEGSLVYLDAPDLDGALSRVAGAGGAVVLPKLDIGPPGFIAIVRDTEGNHVGLHRPR
jgi:hypothetical protein